jgi:hypothetical protein
MSADDATRSATHYSKPTRSETDSCVKHQPTEPIYPHCTNAIRGVTHLNQKLATQSDGRRALNTHPATQSRGPTHQVKLITKPPPLDFTNDAKADDANQSGMALNRFPAMQSEVRRKSVTPAYQTPIPHFTNEVRSMPHPK